MCWRCTSGSEEMTIRPSKSSGRTSWAMAAKSCGERMSAFPNFIPPLGHSRTALSSASSSVGAHDRCSCRTLGMVSGSLPASRAPSANFPSSISIFSGGAPTVMMPSACRPVFFALTGPAVATRIGGGASGMVHSRVVSIRKNSPANFVSFPATDASKSCVMRSTASNIRRERSPASGQ